MQGPIINSCSYIPWLVPNSYGFVMSSGDVFIDSLELFIDSKCCSLTTVCVCVLASFPGKNGAYCKQSKTVAREGLGMAMCVQCVCVSVCV